MSALRLCFADTAASHQARGRMPRNRKVLTAARLTQTTLAATRTDAPNAAEKEPSASNIPTVTSGGINATAIITPTRDIPAPAVSARAPAAPDASASARSLRLITVRLAIASLNGVSTPTTAPITIATARVRTNPTALARIERANSGPSPSVVASARAMLGPSRGAMTIAPTRISELPRVRPTAATIAERTIVIR